MPFLIDNLSAINVATAVGGALLVEIVSQGNTLVERSAGEWIPVVGDFTDHTVQWWHGHNMTQPAISLRFILQGQVDLYSFWFSLELASAGYYRFEMTCVLSHPGCHPVLEAHLPIPFS